MSASLSKGLPEALLARTDLPAEKNSFNSLPPPPGDMNLKFTQFWGLKIKIESSFGFSSTFPCWFWDQALFVQQACSSQLWEWDCQWPWGFEAIKERSWFLTGSDFQ